MTQQKKYICVNAFNVCYICNIQKIPKGEYIIMKLLEDKKKKVSEEVENIDKILRSIALTIHENPELGYEEYKAVELLTNLLETEGFRIERNVAGLDTAFIATYSEEKEGPTIGLLGEYDALPEIGHACGHNLIGTASTGAAIALKKVYKGKLKGKIKVIGT